MEDSKDEARNWQFRIVTHRIVLHALPEYRVCVDRVVFVVAVAVAVVS